jgi:hypothetical protein
MRALLNRLRKVHQLLAYLNLEETNRQILLEDGGRIIVE